MVTLLRENKSFLSVYGIVLFFVTILHFFFNKPEIHLTINRAYSAFGDFFFKYVTHLGDGLTTILIVVLLLFVSYRKSLMVLGSFLAGGLIVQLFKRTIFSDADRPIRFFKDITELHIVEGVKLYGAHSFPSGHSASVFSLFFCLAIFVRNKWIKHCCLVLALLVAYSRVYLSQHFLVDAVAGSLIGLLVVFPFYQWVFLSKIEWLNFSLMNLWRSKAGKL